jgi:hypothetical protein
MVLVPCPRPLPVPGCQAPADAPSEGRPRRQGRMRHEPTRMAWVREGRCWLCAVLSRAPANSPRVCHVRERALPVHRAGAGASRRHAAWSEGRGVALGGCVLCSRPTRRTLVRVLVLLVAERPSVAVMERHLVLLLLVRQHEQVVLRR